MGGDGLIMLVSKSITDRARYIYIAISSVVSI